MEILNFKQFLVEAEGSAKGADAIGAMTSFLGIMPKDVPEVLSKDKKLVVNTLIRRKFPVPLQIAISPVASEPKFVNGKCVGADIEITPEEDEPFSYVYLNKSLNKNRLKPLKTSISPSLYNKFLTTGLQPS